MEALPNLASEKFHTDMSCIGIESKTFLTELKLQRYISPGPPNMQKNVVQAVLLPSVKVHCLLVQSGFQILLVFYLHLWSSEALWNIILLMQYQVSIPEKTFA